MPRSTQKTSFLIGVFLCCCAAIILASVAYSTRYWITQSYDHDTMNTSTYNDEPFTINAGLFVLDGHNPAFGGPFYMSMKDAYTEYHDFMNFGLWISTILFISLGMVFGVVSAVFAAVNSATTPIEEITGVTGLYLWNGLACLFSLIAVFLWVAQYCGYLVDVLWSLSIIDESIRVFVTTHEPSKMGYSFYLMCGVAFLYLLNLGLVYLSTSNLNKNKTPVLSGEDVTPDGLIMLY